MKTTKRLADNNDSQARDNIFHQAQQLWLAYDCIGIESPDVLNNFAMQISLILDSKHVIIWVIKQFILPIFPNGWKYLWKYPISQFFGNW